MSKISDFAASQNLHNQKVAAALDALGTDIQKQNDLIAKMQQSPGVLSTEDQATLDALDAGGAALQTKAEALTGITPPVVPTAA